MNLDELESLLCEATAGPWIGAGPSFGDPLPRYTNAMVTEWEDDDGGSPTICEFGYACRDDENEANAALIAALRNSAEELIRDARRMQWIDDHAAFIDTVGDADNRVRVWYSATEKSASGRAVREAIDAAIAQEKP